MPDFQVQLTIGGVDLDDDAVVDRLAENEPSLLWRSDGSHEFVLATIQASTGFEAIFTVVDKIMALVPTARPLAVDEDLVSTPDIASRVPFSRETVRLWANGAIGKDFPIPRGVVGDGIKVWAWGDVNSWLRSNYGLGDPYSFPSRIEAALASAKFAAIREEVVEVAPAPAAARELVAW